MRDHRSSNVQGLKAAGSLILTSPATVPNAPSPESGGHAPSPRTSWTPSASPDLVGNFPTAAPARPSRRPVYLPTSCSPPLSAAAAPPEPPSVSSDAPSPSPSAAAPLCAGPAVCANWPVVPSASPSCAASPVQGACCCNGVWAADSWTEKRAAAQSDCPAGR